MFTPAEPLVRLSPSCWAPRLRALATRQLGLQLRRASTTQTIAA